MRPRWSQNFLANPGAARVCVQALDPVPGDAILEIGPGKGVLTRLLLEKSPNVTAIEIDPALCDFLRRKFEYMKGLRLVPGDFLEIDLDQLKNSGSEKYKVIGNLPYAVVSPILQKLLAWNGWSKAVLMMQKEVGERIMAEPGTKAYGILAISVQSRSRIGKVLQLSRHSFHPVPKVESVVLELSPLDRPLFQPSEEKAFFRVVKAAFSHRRKTLINSLQYDLDLPAPAILKAVEAAGLSPKARAETITLPEFKQLSEILDKVLPPQP